MDFPGETVIFAPATRPRAHSQYRSLVVSLRDLIKPWLWVGAALLAGAPLQAQQAAASAAGQVRRPHVAIDAFYGILSTNETLAMASLGRIRDRWRDAYVAPLLDMLGLIPHRTVQAEVEAMLQKATGRRPDGSIDPWYEWLWSREPGEHPDYAEFKATLYEQIDPRFREYFGKGRKSSIRLDEIRWGGVRRDGNIL